jgi:hypothetical protein
MRLRIVVVATLSMVAFAVPTARVDAKGPIQLVVSGDGIDGAIVVRATDRPGRWWTLVEAARFLEFGAGSDAVALRQSGDVAPGSDLGTRLRLTWIVPGGGDDGETSRLSQDLYPFARGGARLYSPADQTVYGHPLAAGWRRVDSNVITLLRRFGVPVARHAVTADVHAPRPSPASAFALVRW